MYSVGTEVGIGETQARKYIRELEAAKLIQVDRENRHYYRGGGGGTNGYVFLCNACFEGDRGQSQRKQPPLRQTEAKESQLKRVNPRESGNDYDCAPRNRKKRDTALRDENSTSSTAWLCEYSNLRRKLREHMKETDPDLPSQQNLIRIIQATGNVKEQEIISAVDDLYRRGYDETHVNTYGWFITTLEDYFDQKRKREESQHPSGYDAWAGRNERRNVDDFPDDTNWDDLVPF
jgi:hypothetical protein